MNRHEFMEFIRSDDLQEKLSYDDAIEACLAVLGFNDDLYNKVQACIEEFEGNL